MNMKRPLRLASAWIRAVLLLFMLCSWMKTAAIGLYALGFGTLPAFRRFAVLNWCPSQLPRCPSDRHLARLGTTVRCEFPLLSCCNRQLDNRNTSLSPRSLSVRCLTIYYPRVAWTSSTYLSQVQPTSASNGSRRRPALLPHYGEVRRHIGCPLRSSGRSA